MLVLQIRQLAEQPAVLEADLALIAGGQKGLAHALRQAPVGFEAAPGARIGQRIALPGPCLVRHGGRFGQQCSIAAEPVGYDEVVLGEMLGVGGRI